jgi:ribonucleoside-diphosphate reductase alpha chain
MNKSTDYQKLVPYSREAMFDFVLSHCEGIDEKEDKASLITDEVALTLFEDMTSENLIDSAILIATQNIQNDTDFDKIATRILLTKIYRNALITEKKTLEETYKQSFIDYLNAAVKDRLLDSQLIDLFDINDLGSYLKIERDDLFKYIGLSTMSNRYMIRYRDHKYAETPQFLWMRVAMGLSLKEENPTQQAKKFYDKLSKLEYISGGSTLIGSGTNYPVLSNCFLLDTEDDINSIFDNVKNVALISKGTGGIGMAITKLRAEGSPIKTNNTFSSGPIPFSHVMDSTIRAISRAGKKMGALCLYMENWHINFPEFLDLKQNAGDDYRRTRTANTAAYISDEFMKRVMNDEDWYMFDPAETPELTELYGAEFSKKYKEYEQKAKAGELHMFSKVKAKEQMRQMLILLQASSHPWLTWKDTINLRALNNNTGTIHCSNLCTEVCLPTDRQNVAVCNLLYVNLVTHIQDNSGEEIEKKIDWEKLKDSVKVGIRQLDNLIDVGLSPIAEAKNSDTNNRAVGLGIMGFAETLERLGLAYESQESYDLIDRVIEFISYNCIEESCDLAEVRGSYANFKGSMWSKGFVPYDTISKVEEDRNITLEQNRIKRLDWEVLRKRVKKGIRNATLMMIAPTASTGLVAGTSPGIDPRFAQIFSRSTNSGKFLDINENLVKDLKQLGVWDKVKENVLASYGDISNIPEIPEDLKRIYKTSFQISPRAFIEVASRAQKWIDQSISRNMYLDTRDTEEMVGIYTDAWKRGLKTTYYLHMKPRHSAEQSTIKVNKSESIGKKGFGFVKSTPAPTQIVSARIEVEKETIEVTESVTMTSTTLACPIDPMERAKCEGCQ